jgi:hypothetical protein
MKQMLGSKRCLLSPMPPTNRALHSQKRPGLTCLKHTSSLETHTQEGPVKCQRKIAGSPFTSHLLTWKARGAGPKWSNERLCLQEVVKLTDAHSHDQQKEALDPWTRESDDLDCLFDEEKLRPEGPAGMAVPSAGDGRHEAVGLKQSKCPSGDAAFFLLNLFVVVARDVTFASKRAGVRSRGCALF